MAADPITAVGLVGTIVQFIDFTAKIIKRLEDFQKCVDEAPKAFRDLHTQLPLLQKTLKNTKLEADSNSLDADTKKVVLDVVKGCQEQVELLDAILVKTLPAQGSSRLKRGIKALSSVWREKEVKAILSQIERYQFSLMHYHAAGSVHALPARPKPLFMVPFERDQQFIGRQESLRALDEHFKTNHRAALTGLGGVGYVLLSLCKRSREAPLRTVRMKRGC